MLSRSSLLAAVPFSFLLAGCSAGATPEVGASEPEKIGVAASAITGATIIANGEEWVNAELHYCQAAYGKVDDDQSCWAWEGSSHVCDRESNSAWNAYRSDCSGFITWSWGLPPVGDGGYVTGDFAPFSTSISTEIQATDLQPGDAANLTAGGHIVLFKEWVTQGKEAIFLEEPGCDSTIPYAHQFQSAVTISGSSIYIDYEGDSFTAIRYTGLATAAPDYAASFVSQSWPYASTTMKMKAGQVLAASITMKNVGAKTWNSSTKLATTQPRDRTSVFAGKDWLAPNRLAALSGTTTVAPGDTFEFKFSFYAPTKPGTYDELFGIVQDGVVWFSDSGEGGPADNVIEAKIEVVAEATDGGAEDAGDTGSSATTGAGGSGAGGTGESGTGGTSSANGGATGTGGTGGTTSASSSTSTASRGSSTSSGETPTSGKGSSCSYAPSTDPHGTGTGAAWLAAIGLAFAVSVSRRRAS